MAKVISVLPDQMMQVSFWVIGIFAAIALIGYLFMNIAIAINHRIKSRINLRPPAVIFVVGLVGMFVGGAIFIATIVIMFFCILFNKGG